MDICNCRSKYEYYEVRNAQIIVSSFVKRAAVLYIFDFLISVPQVLKKQKKHSSSCRKNLHLAISVEILMVEHSCFAGIPLDMQDHKSLSKNMENINKFPAGRIRELIKIRFRNFSSLLKKIDLRVLYGLDFTTFPGGRPMTCLHGFDNSCTIECI